MCNDTVHKPRAEEEYLGTRAEYRQNVRASRSPIFSLCNFAWTNPLTAIDSDVFLLLWFPLSHARVPASLSVVLPITLLNLKVHWLYLAYLHADIDFFAITNSMDCIKKRIKVIVRISTGNNNNSSLIETQFRDSIRFYRLDDPLQMRCINSRPPQKVISSVNFHYTLIQA